MSEPQKASKGISLWLALSLAANALLIGVVGGKILAGERHGPREDRRERHEHASRLKDTLSDQQLSDLRRDLAKAWRDSGDARARHEAVIADIKKLVVAEPFDEAALIDALARLREAESGLRARTHEVIAEQLSTLDQKQREAVITQLVGLRSPRLLRRGKDGGDGPRHHDGEGRGPGGRPPGDGFPPDGPPPGGDMMPPPGMPD